MEDSNCDLYQLLYKILSKTSTQTKEIVYLSQIIGITNLNTNEI